MSEMGEQLAGCGFHVEALPTNLSSNLVYSVRSRRILTLDPTFDQQSSTANTDCPQKIPLVTSTAQLCVAITKSRTSHLSALMIEKDGAFTQSLIGITLGPHMICEVIARGLANPHPRRDLNWVSSAAFALVDDLRSRVALLPRV